MNKCITFIFRCITNWDPSSTPWAYVSPCTFSCVYSMDRIRGVGVAGLVDLDDKTKLLVCNILL